MLGAGVACTLWWGRLWRLRHALAPGELTWTKAVVLRADRAELAGPVDDPEVPPWRPAEAEGPGDTLVESDGVGVADGDGDSELEDGAGFDDVGGDTNCLGEPLAHGVALALALGLAGLLDGRPEPSGELLPFGAGPEPVPPPWPEGLEELDPAGAPRKVESLKAT